ncbi:MAG: hypothetical protein GY754_06795 [bacterium]|nr:hypothetical protein [bacterium]
MLVSNKKILLIVTLLIIFLVSCSSKKRVVYPGGKRAVAPGSQIAVIIDAKNNIKNVVLAKFLSQGFKVKAINASDLYKMRDIFDIKDLKKVSHKVPSGLKSMEKTYNNVYKLHFYNFEINKANLLEEIKNKWGVQYLILLDLKDWGGVTWGRAINLRTYEIVWLENYPTGYYDNIETILDHFIASMSGR